MRKRWRWFIAVFAIASLVALAVTPAEYDPVRLEHPAGTVWVKIDDVSPHLVNAIIAAEDKDFEQHGSVEFLGIARGVVPGIEHHDCGGGSTITMQLAKILEPPRAHKRYDAIYLSFAQARRLEHSLTKREILEQHVNRVYFGDGYFGIAAGSRGYFGKDPSDLSLAESALLAGLLKSPSGYGPVRNPAKAVARRDQVLDLIAATKRESIADVGAAKAEPLAIQPGAATSQPD